MNAQPSDRALAEEAWQRSRETSAPFSFDFTLWKVDGDVFWINMSTQPMLGPNNEVIGFIGTAHDVTEAMNRRVLNNQLIGLLDSSADAVIVFDPRGKLVFSNDGARALIGVSEQSAASDTATQMFIQAIRDQVPREVISSPTHNKWEGELGFRSPDGILRTLNLVLHIVRAADGAIAHYSVIARDITQAKQLQDELNYQATHDALTGLPNRVLFLRKLSEALERSVTTKRGVSVMFVDLDKLKDVNDNIGHNVGDQLLNSIAKRLVSATRPSDLVARIGGDEFVVLCDGLGDEHIAMDVAERVRQGITGQVILQGVEIFTSGSIGVAMATPALLAEEAPADAAVTLLRNADTAMYRAKQRGRGRCEMYSDEMRKNAKDRVVLSAELERALAKREMFVVYQPVVSTHTGRIAGVEALLRWNHPERGLLTPPMFLDLAEESGSIGPIGDWVIRQACSDARMWMDEGIVERSFMVHVNVSTRQLSEAAFVERVMGTLRDTNVDAAHLTLEITEKTMLNDNPAVMRTLNALKRLGVKLALDDFGTGYASLAYLRDFPADYLKLDGTLVRDIGQHGGDDPIVRSIIQLAHSLNMSVVAEWVTTEDQKNRLRLLGCDFMQGNRVAQAVAADELRIQLRSRTSSVEERN